MLATDAIEAMGDSPQPGGDAPHGNSNEYGDFVKVGHELVPASLPRLMVKAYLSTIWNLDIMQERLEETLSLAYALREATAVTVALRVADDTRTGGGQERKPQEAESGHSSGGCRRHGGQARAQPPQQAAGAAELQGSCVRDEACHRNARMPRHQQPKDSEATHETVAEVKNIKMIGNAVLENGGHKGAYDLYQTAVDIINAKCGLGLGCGLERDAASRTKRELSQLYIDLQNNSAEAALRSASAFEEQGDGTEAMEALYAAMDAAYDVLELDKENSKATHRLNKVLGRIALLEGAAAA
jgi:hypothetical protein